MGVFQRHVDWIFLKIKKNEKLIHLKFKIVYFYHEMGEQRKKCTYEI